MMIIWGAVLYTIVHCFLSADLASCLKDASRLRRSFPAFPWHVFGVRTATFTTEELREQAGGQSCISVRGIQAEDLPKKLF